MLSRLVASFGLTFRRAAVALMLAASAASAAAQSACTTGLCLQQVSCPNGGSTTITGKVYAPNNVDPLPNVLVYIPNAPVAAFSATVGCTITGVVPSGSPIVGTTTGIDGSFLLTNVPVGSNIPLVIQTGRWRRQVVVSTVTACATNNFSTRFPQTQAEGDIPKIAIATGAEDGLECVLRKVGIQDTEFTGASGTGRVVLYKGSGAGGATVASSTSQDVLMSDPAALASFDIVMFPCQGSQYVQTTARQQNLIDYANNGGRVYATHYSYVWLYNDAPFSGTANWTPQSSNLADGIATIDTTYPNGLTMADWLQNIGATTTQGQIALSTLRKDQSGIVSPPSQSVLTLNSTGGILQFTFDTPIGVPAASQCGKVLFNEYHVENPATPLANTTFPNECPTTTMSPQEKLLEFSLFDLSGNSVIPTLTPASANFGSVAVGITSATQTFTWTNPSPFPVAVSAVNVSGDYAIASNTCLSGGINAGASCQIAVSFTPTVVGTRTGTLSVTSGLTTLKSSLTGTGVPDIQLSVSSLAFGNIDVGGVSAPQTLTVTNAVPTTIALQPLALSGDYAIAATTCGSSLGPLATCTVTITFRPTVSGARPGTLTVSAVNSVYGSATATLTGNGVDFSLTLSPASGSTTAGISASTVGTLMGLGGYNGTVTLTCTSNAAASVCTPAPTSAALGGTAVTVAVGITTTAKYTVVGYGGLGGGLLLTLFGGGAGALVWMVRRKRGNALLRACLMVLLLAGVGAWTTGCSGKLPDQNSPYTAAGSYTYTLTATDGFLTHSATYSLTVK